MTTRPTIVTAPIITADRAFPEGTRHDIPVAGGTLCVERCGAGPALILLHGFTLDRRAWGPQAPLERWLTLIAPDRRGNGLSTAAADIGQEPADILAIADVLGFDRFALLGHSQGARVALHAALAAPLRVSHLILAGAPHDAVAETLPRSAMRSLATEGRFEDMRTLWLAEPMMATHSRAAGGLRDRIVRDYDGRDLLVPQPPLALDDDLIARVRAPLTVLVGAADTAARQAAARRIARVRPGTRHIILPGAGHLANMDAPGAFNAAVLEALEASQAA